MFLPPFIGPVLGLGLRLRIVTQRGPRGRQWLMLTARWMGRPLYAHQRAQNAKERPKAHTVGSDPGRGCLRLAASKLPRVLAGPAVESVGPFLLPYVFYSFFHRLLFCKVLTLKKSVSNCSNF